MSDTERLEGQTTKPIKEVILFGYVGASPVLQPLREVIRPNQRSFEMICFMEKSGGGSWSTLENTVGWLFQPSDDFGLSLSSFWLAPSLSRLGIRPKLKLNLRRRGKAEPHYHQHHHHNPIFFIWASTQKKYNSFLILMSTLSNFAWSFWNPATTPL